MSLTGKKASTPFKTMDIKAALLAGGNRKRKASSPQACKDEPKSKKLSTETSDHENDIEIVNEVPVKTVTLSQDELDSALGDCKENKDINSAKLETLVVGSKENNQLTPTKEEVPATLNSSFKSAKTESPDSSKEAASDNDVEIQSDRSENSETTSCSEQNTSKNNVSLNTSGLSVTGEDEEGKQTSSQLKGENDKTEKTKNTGDKERIKKKKMTPAEAQKRAEEREKKQKEKELKKQEIENQRKERLLEKERKLKEKALLEERKEFERKERERIKQEKKEQEEKEKLQRQKEKEEKAKLKQMLLEQKLEEKKRKEEMKLKKEEEMKKAEEERLKAKLEKEQKEREKQEKAKAAFAKFFLKAENTSVSSSQTAEKEGFFRPFQVSDDMTLAPTVPPAAQERFNRKQLDHFLESQDGKELYLHILKSGSYKDVRHRKKKRKFESSDADVIVIDKTAELGLCPKLLQFCENVRPPYWGTWRKKSTNIRPRNPLGEDEIFDYSVDSDDEWDEGGPGESLSGTENEDESEDDYEVDNEFFVPHGYLSDEEEKKEDDDEEVNDPEKQKALLKLKLQEFETERKKKTTELKPVILGCYFVHVPVFKDNGLQGFLQTFSAEFISESPIPTSFTVKAQQNDNVNNSAESPKSISSAQKKRSVPDEALPQLIRLVHGNTKNRRILAEEFQKYWCEQSGENNEVKQDKAEKLNSETDPSKEAAKDVPPDLAQISLRQLNQTIKEIATYGKPPETSSYNRCCWWVHDNIREKYGLMDAPVPNQWKYTLQKEAEPVPKNNSVSIKGFLSAN